MPRGYQHVLRKTHCVRGDTLQDDSLAGVRGSEEESGEEDELDRSAKEKSGGGPAKDAEVGACGANICRKEPNEKSGKR